MSGRAADGVFHWVAVALVALAVAALTIGLYDIEVRQPRTPRLAVVDIARLFVVAEQRGKQNVLAGAARNELPAGDGRAPSRGDPDSAGAALAFGGRVETVLNELSTECRCAVVAGRSTGTSTVASGAAIMKMISSTRITSMNGVTLISWVSAKSSPSCPRRMATALLRRARHMRGRIERGHALAVAADQPHHQRRAVREQRAIAADGAR